MTSILPPMCVVCARFLNSGGFGFKCEAYPDGIPREIIEGEWDHRFPKPGDRGLRFVPRDDAEPWEWWPDESEGGAGGPTYLRPSLAGTSGRRGACPGSRSSARRPP